MSKIAVSEEALIAARKGKAEQIRARGENPFANDLSEPPIDLIRVRESFTQAKKDDGTYDADLVSPYPVRVAGRIIFLRSFGELVFIRLRDRTGEMQLYCEKTTLTEFDRLNDLDIGDFVEANGITMVSQKGELSVRPNTIRVLTKSYRPIATKTAFKDTEERYRNRSADLVANADVRKIFQARTAIVSALRSFLDGRDFLEVETSTMHSVLGGATAKPFTTHHNALDMNLYMRIAPELFLKRLVVGGFERVYEIARCYRNEGISTRHNPEFTMLEFYQAYATYETLMQVTQDMLRHVDACLARKMPVEHSRWYQNRTYSLERFVRLTMKEALGMALEASGLPTCSEMMSCIGANDAPIKEWAKASKERGREIDWTNFRTGIKKCASAGEKLFCAYEYLAEPFLTRDYQNGHGKSLPVFITDYPYEVSPLARKKDTDPTLVDRFELFIDGRELCNAFSELNDPEDQAARFQAQVDKKSAGAEETMEYDANYIRALEYGMPPTAGFGMGVDRLVMLLTGASSIRDVILFPLLRNQ